MSAEATLQTLLKEVTALVYTALPRGP